jgi:hypothetical protein
MEKRKRRKKHCFTSPDTWTSSWPSATPASSVPVTAPSVKLPSLIRPRT